jgi:ribosomal protein S18 acetylase RimI-like enzyme
MPEVDIRPAIAEDIPVLVAMEHSYKSSYVWQMDLNVEEGQVMVSFREIRLPRPVTVEYPRSPLGLTRDWTQRSVFLVGLVNHQLVAYISLMESIAPTTAWVTDLVVAPAHRRQGIASALLLAAQDWATRRQNRRMIIEVQSKNLAAIHMAMKLGYEFCGYNDHYYSNQDIALFFAQFIR